MTLQYFVTASDTGNRIPIEVDKSTPADLAGKLADRLDK